MPRKSLLCTCLQCHGQFLVNDHRTSKPEAIKYCSRVCHAVVQSAEQASKFWEKVAICVHGLDCPYCCWPWQGFVRYDGYGAVTKHKRPYGAYRRAWEYWHGMDMPSGLDACHYCHNPLCVNPAHIHPGTRQDNQTESVLAHRFPVGEARANTKLTEADVRLILQWHRDEGIGCYVISKRIGVSNTTVYAILKGRTWKHIS